MPEPLNNIVKPYPAFDLWFNIVSYVAIAVMIIVSYLNHDPNLPWYIIAAVIIPGVDYLVIKKAHLSTYVIFFKQSTGGIYSFPRLYLVIFLAKILIIAQVVRMI